MDILHDFNTGTKSYSGFYLDLYGHQTHDDHSSEDNNGLSGNNKWQTKFSIDGAQVTNAQSFPNSTADTGAGFTRTKVVGGVGTANSNMGIPADYWSGIYGSEYPYPFSISAAGVHQMEVELFHEPHEVGVLNTQSVEWKIFQRAVCVTKNDSGTILGANRTIVHVDQVDVLIFDKSENRGDEIASYWRILIANSDGVYVDAALGVDYTLGGGEILGDSVTLGTDVINVTFTGGGNGGIFRVLNICSGYTTTNNIFGGTSTGIVHSNTDALACVVIVEPDANTFQINNESITFPNLVPTLVETSGHTSVITSTPLVAYENLYLNVTPNLSFTNSESWTRALTVHTLSPSSSVINEYDIEANWGMFGFLNWFAEFYYRTDMFVVILKNGIEIERKKVDASISPIEFVLGKGEHVVRVEVRNKVNPNDIPLNDIPIIDSGPDPI